MLIQNGSWGVSDMLNGAGGDRATLGIAAIRPRRAMAKSRLPRSAELLRVGAGLTRAGVDCFS
ncbi:MAG: hypothetical protein HY286_12625 [Planctomycetes bacterium]|nr:hypothetical protein [Planctomycetota bacterium]